MRDIYIVMCRVNSTGRDYPTRGFSYYEEMKLYIKEMEKQCPENHYWWDIVPFTE